MIKRTTTLLRLLSLAVVLLLSTAVNGQLAIRYNLAISSGSYSSISGTGTLQSGIVADNGIINLAGILSPTFSVNGTAYSNVRISSNGWLILYGATAPTTTTESSILSTAVTNGAVIIAPMNADLIQ